MSIALFGSVWMAYRAEVEPFSLPRYSACRDNKGNTYLACSAGSLSTQDIRNQCLTRYKVCLPSKTGVAWCLRIRGRCITWISITISQRYVFGRGTHSGDMIVQRGSKERCSGNMETSVRVKQSHIAVHEQRSLRTTEASRRFFGSSR
jgi:hypothetical protein